MYMNVYSRLDTKYDQNVVKCILVNILRNTNGENLSQADMSHESEPGCLSSKQKLWKWYYSFKSYQNSIPSQKVT